MKNWLEKEGNEHKARLSSTHEKPPNHSIRSSQRQGKERISKFTNVSTTKKGKQGSNHKRTAQMAIQSLSNSDRSKLDEKSNQGLGIVTSKAANIANLVAIGSHSNRRLRHSNRRLRHSKQ
jgi:hypothetical protein